MKKLIAPVNALVLTAGLFVGIPAASAEETNTTVDSYATTSINGTEVAPLPEGNDATLESEKTPIEDIGIMPMVAYDYSIPTFSLVGYEYAWTTRSGYGFYVNNDGLNHRDLNVSFNVVAQKGIPEGVLALVKFSDWANATTRAKIQSDVRRYAYAYQNFSGAGSKTISFNNLSVDTKWVFIWKNAATGTEFDVKNGNVYSTY